MIGVLFAPGLRFGTTHLFLFDVFRCLSLSIFLAICMLVHVHIYKGSSKNERMYGLERKEEEWFHVLSSSARFGWRVEDHRN